MRRLRCFSTGSYHWAHILRVLIMYLFFLLVMLPSEVPRLTTDSPVRVFPGIWKLLSFKTPFPGWISVLASFVSLFIFYIFSYLLWRQWAAFLGAWCSLPEFRSWFCGIYSAFKCSFDEFVGEKVVSLSYSSTVLGPPLHWLYRLIWGEFTSYYWVF